MSKKLDEKFAKLSSDKQELLELRHTTEHVLHTAMQNLFPNLKKALGPATDDGFYFDFDLDEKVSEGDFERIEEEMKRLVATRARMVPEEISVDRAKELFVGNSYKQDWVEQIRAREEKVQIYKMVTEAGELLDLDLCSGPHLDTLEAVRYFKLLSVAGAYWHGDEKNKMLTRIYGTAFFTKEELEAYLWQIEEAKKRDHRKLGKQLDLFTFSELVGSGFPLYTPKGALVRRLINEYVEEVQRGQEYMQVWTPQVGKAELFKTSGHYDKYQGDMFRVVSNYSKEEFFLKPMNCPHAQVIYASRPRSYKDLPIRMTDFAMLYRDERPGELSGLARVRSFSQDDCHVFCREDQVDEEVDKMLAMTKEVMRTFDLKYRYRLSTRDPENRDKYLGDPKTWDKVEAWAVEIMRRNKIDYFDGPGEAAFYAPKMDLMATDALGREWQLSTVQIDYVQPARFDLVYTDKDGSEKTPVMLHRAIVGSAERFMMVLLEHFAGALPLWLSPIQVRVLPVSEKVDDYAKEVNKTLLENGIRSELDAESLSLGKRIRNAEGEKIPYMLIVGEKEADSNSVSVRMRGERDLGTKELEKFMKEVRMKTNGREAKD